MKRVSGVDAAFLYGETPSWHMHVSGVIIVDPSTSPDPFTVDKLKQMTVSRIHLAPQFRWKLVEVPLGLDRPLFVDDPNFDIDYHVRHIAVPVPGGREELGELLGDLASYKLDRTRPLWEMWFIEGLEDGRVAIFTKVHHSIIDGVSGSDLAALLLDLAPVPAPSELPPPPAETAERMPTTAELLVRGAVATLLTPLRVARYVPQVLRQGRTMLDFKFQLGTEHMPPAPFQAPRVSVNARISPHRRFAWATVPLADIKAIKDAFGVKLNDVVLAVCSGALRRYLSERGELPTQPLVAQVPVSTRTEQTRSDVGMQVAAMFTSLETHIGDAGERLRAINRRTRDAKEMREAMAAKKIMNLTDTTPPGLIGLAARMYTAGGLEARTPPPFNLIVSNVPGLPIPLYACGARVVAMYPMGPLLYGSGLNVSVMSNVDKMDFGFLVCREAVPNPWPIADAIPPALDELRSAAGINKRRKKKQVTA